jgi:hypothetical protein
VYLALSTIAITQPLLQLYGSNVAVFAAANYEGTIVVWFALAVLIVPTATMLLIDVAASRVVTRYASVVHLALVFVGSWAVSSVIFRSVSFGPWIIHLLFTGLFGAGITLAYHRVGTVKSWLALLSPLSIVVAIVFVVSAMSVISPPTVEVLALETSASTTSSGTPAEDVSVLWITLDEAPLFSLLNTKGEINANRFPGFAELANSSTWYRNVLATSQTTTDAVPAMLTGKWPTAGTGPVLANYPNNLFTLMNGHLSMDGNEVATALCPRDVCSTVSVSGGDHIADSSSASLPSATTVADQSIEATAVQRTSLSAFFRDALVVVGHKISPAGLRENLPPIDEGWGGFGAIDDVDAEVSDIEVPDSESETQTKETREVARSTTVQQWQTGGPMSQVPVMEDLITRASRAGKPTLHFTHALLPHRPWMLTPDMRRSRALPTDKRSNTIVDRVRDEYQAYLLQMAATDNIIANMMADMKKSANWNRTMIIVTADHGLTFMPGESKRKTVDPTNKGTLEDLYRIPLFIKYPDQTQATTNDCPASSIDLLATVIAATGVDAGWETDGVDLATTCPVRKMRKIIWKEGSSQMSSTFTAAISRAKYYDKWVDAEGDVTDIVRVGQHGALVGTSVRASADSDSSLTWSLNNADDFNKVTGGRFGFVPSQVQGNITAQRDIAPNEEAYLMVGNRVIGVISEVAGLKAGESTTFRSTLHWASLPAGKHAVALWLVGRDASGNRTLTPQP